MSYAKAMSNLSFSYTRIAGNLSVTFKNAMNSAIPTMLTNPALKIGFKILSSTHFFEVTVGVNLFHLNSKLFD